MQWDIKQLYHKHNIIVIVIVIDIIVINTQPWASSSDKCNNNESYSCLGYNYNLAITLVAIMCWFLSKHYHESLHTMQIRIVKYKHLESLFMLMYWVCCMHACRCKASKLAYLTMASSYIKVCTQPYIAKQLPGAKYMYGSTG